MNSQERIDAVINLEAPDRVPIAPLLDHFAATYTGITKQDIIENWDMRQTALMKTAQDMGPWDMSFMGETIMEELLMGAPTRVRWPGRDLPADDIHQFDEFEFMTPEDYDLLVKIGLMRFLKNMAYRLHPELNFFKSAKMAFNYMWGLKKQVKQYKKAGIVPAVGFMIPGPMFEFFSLGRSMVPMCMDIFDHPERLKAADMVWAKALTKQAIMVSRILGVPRIFIGLARTSPDLISPAHFEEFAWPGLQHMVYTMLDKGITPMFHCDGNWEMNFNFFKQFPAKKIILELDSSTDIFKAKEELGDRMCIMGDVPATLLAFGTREETLQYCKKLIQEVGKGGGFILSSGCSLPANAKPENVRAMYEAVEKWGYY